jgi:hypothetical protein
MGVPCSLCEHVPQRLTHSTGKWISMPHILGSMCRDNLLLNQCLRKE